MSLTAILLIFVSACLHAGWNALSRSRRPTASFFLLANAAGALLLSPAWILRFRTLAAFPPRVWALLAGAGFCMAVYCGALAGAYRRGQLSVAYPLVRSSPILVVSIVAFLLGRGHQISPRALAGIGLVVGGGFLLPMRHLRDLRLANYWNASCGFALLAAAGTAGYTVLDDEALRLLRGGGAAGPGPGPATLLYASLEALACALWLLLGVILRPSGRANLKRERRENLGAAVASGAAIWAGYGLVLFSLAFVANVSYAAAFRQISILMGVAIGTLGFREPAPAPKIAGALTIFAGLALVATG